MTSETDVIEVINTGQLPETIKSYQVNTVMGFEHIEIEHNGKANWLDLQYVKNLVWGQEVNAFELYPPQSRVVNGGSTEFHFRHIFRWPAFPVWPDIRGLC